MKIEIKKFIWPSIISSLVLLALGLLLFFKSAVTLMSISYVIGSILLALGVIAIIRFITKDKDIFNQLNIVYGIISILGGIFFIKEPEVIGSIMPVVLGIGIIISSSLKIQQALVLKNLGSRYFIGSLITALLCLICGVLLLFNPFKTAEIITKIIGLFLIIYAVFDILNTFFLKKSNSLNIEIGFPKQQKHPKKTKDAKIIKEVKKEKEGE